MTDFSFSNPNSWLGTARRMRILSSTIVGGVVLCGQVLLAPTLGHAQLMTTATINGSVTDSTGAVIPGATVVATDDQTHLSTQTISNQDGTFVLPGLIVGTYTVRFRKAGFGTYAVGGVLASRHRGHGQCFSSARRSHIGGDGSGDQRRN